MGLVVVTRPEPDASDYADELRDHGFDLLVEPMLVIEPLAFSKPDLSQYDGVLFTSANAVRVVGDGFSGVAYCVGKHTAKAAQEAGFSDVFSVNGTGVDLLDHIVALPDSCSNKLLHVCGQHVAFPLVQRLNEAGIKADALCVYHSKYVDQFSDDFIAVLNGGKVNAVTFFSKRTADAFVKNTQAVFSESESESIFAVIWENENG